MPPISQHKMIAALPDPLEPDAIYYVRVGQGFDLYVTDSTGNIAHTLNMDSGMLDQLIRTTQAPTPAPGKVSVYPRSRGGYTFLEMLRSKGRPLTLQPHLGMNRVSAWQPNGATVGNIGLNPSSVGTIGTITPTGTNLASSLARFRLTSAATATQAANYRASQINLWRGNAPGLGGFLSIYRVSLVTLCAGCNGFFGLTSTPNVINPFEIATWPGQFIGLGFKEGVHTNWQVVRRDNAGSPVFVDLGPDWPINDLNAVITLYIYSAPHGDTISVRVVNEVTGLTVDFDFADKIPLPGQFLGPRVHMDNAGLAAAVVFDCYGVYVESDL